MKKALTIVGTTLAVLVTITLIAISVLIWILFTPERLTPVVRNVAKRYITCPHHIGEVELTFFSTFPQFGLAINEFHLINPTLGSPSDTLLTASKVVAKVNIQAFLKNKTIIVDELELNQISATLFTDSLGNSNYNVFVVDTTMVKETESEFTIPFDSITLSRIKLKTANIAYVNKQTHIEANMQDLNTNISCQLIKNKGNGILKTSVSNITCLVENEYYLNEAALQLQLPFHVDLDKMLLELKETHLALNEFEVNLKGSAQIINNSDLLTNLAFALNSCRIESLLALLPPSIATFLEDIEMEGVLALDGTVTGTFNEITMPLVDLNIDIEEGRGKYAALPYKLHDLEGKVSVHLNMNDSLASYATIHQLHAKTDKSSFDISGDVKQFMADMRCNLTIRTNLYLPELAPMLPADLNVKMQGRTKGEARIAFAMSDLDAMAIEKMTISGKLNYTNLNIVYEDSMLVKSAKGGVTFAIPNSHSTQAETRFLRASISTDKLQMLQNETLTATLTQTKLGIETSNLIADERYLSANCTFDIQELDVAMEEITGRLFQPQGKAYMQMDMKNSTAIPTLQMELSMNQLQGCMEDTILVDIKQPKAKVSLAGSLHNKQEPCLRVDYSNAELMAQMGNWLRASTGHVTILADAHRNSEEEHLLLQWNPHLNVELKNGEIKMLSDFPEVSIPEMAFNFDMREFDIKKSSILLGNSDFSLTGRAENIGDWIKDEGLLKGEFNFTSELTDVNQLMKLTSGFGETADSTVVVEDEAKEANPFMVPKGIDIMLRTNINKALIGQQTATNLGGNLYVQDGVLTLEEIGFICQAAKMQLTATYKTPRKNHLYLGFIYHMVDVHIEELASLFPEVVEMVPMLSSFKGQGEFHIAAETYTNAYYKPKVSTLRGACSIQGKDLVLMDSETFTSIAKTLMFNKKTENRIDTLYAEMALFKDKVDVYPLLLTMDKYQAALGGNHYLNMDFNYHISLLKPLRIGVNIEGNMDKPKIKLAKCKYATDFRPKRENAVETQNQRLRKIIRESLNRTMTIKSELP